MLLNACRQPLNVGTTLMFRDVFSHHGTSPPNVVRDLAVLNSSDDTIRSALAEDGMDFSGRVAFKCHDVRAKAFTTDVEAYWQQVLVVPEAFPHQPRLQAFGGLPPHAPIRSAEAGPYSPMCSLTAALVISPDNRFSLSGGPLFGWRPRPGIALARCSAQNARAFHPSIALWRMLCAADHEAVSSFADVQTRNVGSIWSASASDSTMETRGLDFASSISLIVADRTCASQARSTCDSS